MRILAIDPGYQQSAVVLLEDGKPERAEILPNEQLVERLWRSEYDTLALASPQVVIEQIEHYGRGMPAGKEIFDTCEWIGRFLEVHYRASGAYGEKLPRRVVKIHLCGSMRAKDPNIRQALIDRFGPGKEKAIGRKKTPGPLYDIKADLWSALAVAVTWADQHDKQMI